MCPSLVDKEKIIRDQAQKSVDIYITRIRNFAATMPDTVLPPPGLTASSDGPRIGTPANDTSWAGWAISSFTNKLATTSGEIQVGSSDTGIVDQRSASVPPSTSNKPPVPLASKPGMTLHGTKSSSVVPTIASSDPDASFNEEADDFNNEWGGFGDDDGVGDGRDEEDPWGTPPISKQTAAMSYDDQGEPDFAGWLAAQATAKKTTKSPLPKGLSKPSAPVAKSTRPVNGNRSSTIGSAVARKVPPKKEVKETMKAKEEEEEGWGDAW